MLATKSNSYTFQKDGVWYFSRRVPADLRRHYRTGRIAYSLRTKSIRDARVQGNERCCQIELISGRYQRCAIRNSSTNFFEYKDNGRSNSSGGEIGALEGGACFSAQTDISIKIGISSIAFEFKQ